MKHLMIWLLLMTPFFGLGQATVDWYDFTGGVGIALDQDNNSYAAHYDYNPAGDIYLTKRNQQGSIIWQVKYDQTDNTKWEQATYVDTDRDGNIFVSGTLKSGYSSPVNAASIIMKFDSSGTLLWRQVYETSFDGSSTKQCLTDASGNVYILGLGMGASGLVTKIKKYDAAGNPVWNWFDNVGIGAPLRFKFTPDSNLVISARAVVGNVNGYARITMSGSTVFSYYAVQSLTAGDAAGDALGNTYIVHAVNAGGGGTTVRKISAAGTLTWSYNFTPISAFFIEVGNDNMPVIGGFPNSGQPGSSFLKLDAAGSQVWFNPDGDGINAFLSHARIRMDDQNNIYLAASVMTAAGVCKVSSNGTSEWALTFPTGYPQDFRIGNDQAVYVVGGTTARIEQTVSQPCLTPGNVYISNVRPTAFRINWDPVPGAFRYQVQYQVAGASSWMSKTVDSTRTKMVINGLPCGVVYKWKLRTICDTSGVNLVSPFTPEQSFISNMCREGLMPDEAHEESAAMFSVYPVPAGDVITVAQDGEVVPLTVSIYDVHGRPAMKPAFFSGESVSLNVSQLPRGMYFLRIEGAGTSYFRKIAVE